MNNIENNPFEILIVDTKLNKITPEEIKPNMWYYLMREQIEQQSTIMQFGHLLNRDQDKHVSIKEYINKQIKDLKKHQDE